MLWRRVWFKCSLLVFCVSCNLALICGEDDVNYMAQWHMLDNENEIMGGWRKGWLFLQIQNQIQVGMF